MAKISEAKEGLQRIVDAANEKFLALCELTGHDPDEPELTGETESEEGEEGEEDETNGEGKGSGDENTIPEPENAEGGGMPMQDGAEMAAEQAGVEGGAQPPMDNPSEAQQMPTDMGQAGGVPPQGGGGMSPEEEEMLMQQMAAQQSQQ